MILSLIDTFILLRFRHFWEPWFMPHIFRTTANIWAKFVQRRMLLPVRRSRQWPVPWRKKLCPTVTEKMADSKKKRFEKSFKIMSCTNNFETPGISFHIIRTFLKNRVIRQKRVKFVQKRRVDFKAPTACQALWLVFFRVLDIQLRTLVSIDRLLLKCTFLQQSSREVLCWELSQQITVILKWVQKTRQIRYQTVSEFYSLPWCPVCNSLIDRLFCSALSQTCMNLTTDWQNSAHKLNEFLFQRQITYFFLTWVGFAGRHSNCICDRPLVWKHANMKASSQVHVRPVYTTPDFWYGTDTNGTGAKK